MQQDKNLFSALTGITFLTLIVLGILRWIEVPIGDFLDWVVGIAAFWWLTLITTVPWNMHFGAKEILADIKRAKKVTISENDLRYARRIAKWYLFVALLLHVLSAVGLYFLAEYEISRVGYWGAAFALLLTGLRPSVRLLEYVQYRLTAISKEIRYPQDDVQSLRDTVYAQKADVQKLLGILDKDDAESWLVQKDRQLQRLEETVYELKKQNDSFRLQQEQLFQQLSQKTEQRIAQISEDGQFISQVRDLIRFIKNA